jgi:hypothetical protein
MSSYINTACTVTLQEIVNKVKTIPLLRPVLDVSGSVDEPAITAASDVMEAICATSVPNKWNEMEIPTFYTNSYQQDFAGIYPNGASITNLSWLERGIVVDINNDAQPKPFRLVEVGRQLYQATASLYNSATNSPLFMVNYFPNNMLYYGTWGAGETGTSSFGNNPVAGSIYIGPTGITVKNAVWDSGSGGEITFTLNYIPNGLEVGGTLNVENASPSGFNGNFLITSISNTFSSTQVVVESVENPGTYSNGGNVDSLNGGDLSQPNNPITQIQDANGNLLVLTQYGTEGTTAPTALANSAAGVQCSGTGATTIWTVVDPYGQGFRILPVPNQTGVVWAFYLAGQMLPVRFTSLNTLLAPLPDQFEPIFRQGFVAQCYRYSPNEKVRGSFEKEWALWLASLARLQFKQEREKEENRFVPTRGIMSAGGGRGGNWWGAAFPFNGPGPAQGN